MSRRKSNKNRSPERHKKPPPAHQGGNWLYGAHACLAALANPKRRINTIAVTAQAADLLKKIDISHLPPPRIVDRAQLSALLPPDSVHQGLAIDCAPLNAPHLNDVIKGGDDNSVVVVLDQANDPRNIGSVLRSAAAFGADAVIVPDRGTPEASGAMAKAAAGAIERIPLIRVTNLARTLRAMKDEGYWCVGLDGRAEQTLAQAKLSGKTAIVMGAEGSGLRQLTAETCDLLAKIPISQQMESLNLSIAASIALYELNRSKQA